MDSGARLLGVWYPVPAYQCFGLKQAAIFHLSHFKTSEIEMHLILDDIIGLNGSHYFLSSTKNNSEP